MTDPHHDDDPGWFSSMSLLTIFVPVTVLRRAQREGASALGTARQSFTGFAAGLVLIGYATSLLGSGGPNENAMSPGLVAMGVAGYGIASLVVPRLIERPLDCTDGAALVASYRSRFFVRIAFANAAALAGFVGFFLSGSGWLFLLGAAFALPGFVRLAPTRANLERDQESLSASGCGVSLMQALTATTSS